jgi:hypothetical protein
MGSYGSRAIAGLSPIAPNFPASSNQHHIACTSKITYPILSTLIKSNYNFPEASRRLTVHLYRQGLKFLFTIYSIFLLNICCVPSFVTTIYSIFVLLNIILITFILRLNFLILHFSLILPICLFNLLVIATACYLFVTMIFLNLIPYAELLLTYQLLSEFYTCLILYLAMKSGACITTEQLSARVPESLIELQVPIVSFLTVTENKDSEIKKTHHNLQTWIHPELTCPKMMICEHKEFAQIPKHFHIIKLNHIQ